MRKIIILLILAIAILMSGCTDTVNNNFEIEDTNLIQEIQPNDDCIEIVVWDKLYKDDDYPEYEHYQRIHRVYDEENDIFIYYVNGEDGNAMAAIPRNEIEYWKNYDDTETIETI